MTLRAAITMTDLEKPNAYSTEQKISWINEIESSAAAEIYECGFSGIDVTCDQDIALSIPDPYSRVYILYLKAKIDYCDEDFMLYNNDIAQYNTIYQRFSDYVTRNSNKKYYVRGLM